MEKRAVDVDVAVVGAGTAGSAAALMLARAGRTVALFEKLLLAGAGARWINAVPPWMFERAGLDVPSGEELHRPGGPMVMIGPGGQARLELHDTPLWDLHVARLNDRLHELGRAAGVRTFERVRLGEFEVVNGRPVSLALRCGEGREACVRARLFVDASGRAGALRKRLPDLCRDWPPVPREHTCTAAQQVCAISDRVGAAMFLEQHRAEAGQVVSLASPQGGWSLFNLRVDKDFETVDLLAGCIAVPENPTGLDMLEESKSKKPWIGRRLSGGQGLIPLRRPYDRLAAPGIALIGDAGCMVFTLHGSGTGSGLVAARILADASGQHDDPGSEEATWEYQKTFQRQVGCVHAAYDVQRRLLQGLHADNIDLLLGSGLIHAGMVMAGLDQRLPAPGQLGLGRLPSALSRAPAMAARLGPALARMGMAVAAYKAYPSSPDQRLLRHWSRAAARIVGDPADLS